jgi:hypothetical protein
MHCFKGLKMIIPGFGELITKRPEAMLLTIAIALAFAFFIKSKSSVTTRLIPIVSAIIVLVIYLILR